MAEKPYTRLGQTLSIQEVTSNGRIVALSDYSSWEIRWLDRAKSAYWSEDQCIIVTENDNERYPYRIKNIDTDEEIQAKIVMFGVPE